ncbi:DUF7576 family protein [Natronosalvus halobius]|uniref:DUF7576 family protein n=1 Tax=Natronosalvus halobius TaxID=2953746 RepID=UPI00209D9DF7|nr:hypothetical protein [Natronosalvus halobius]USZ70789.1 hypothetical protein NGM15_11845 [Natronosalvus halobius]
MSDDRPDFWNYCAQCGIEYSTAASPPIVDVVTDGGEDSPVSFCSDECRGSWASD